MSEQIDVLDQTTDRQRKNHSLYDRISSELASDKRVQEEVLSGKRVGFYRLQHELGSGNFSQVKLATHVITKELVAVKILDKTKINAKTQRLLAREISSMERLRHPHIIRIYEVMETLSKLYMVTEYAPGGELFTRISRKGKMKENEAKCFFAQIISALDHMHDQHIIHRDLKAENIFFAHPKCVKVGDFGFSTISRPDQTLTTFCGSPPYAAPELFKDDDYLGPAVDVWATGVLLYFMVVGSMPFKAETVGRLKKCILTGDFAIPSHVSGPCRFLILHILRQNPSERLKLSDIRSSTWLQNEAFTSPLDPFEINPRASTTSSGSSSGNSGPGLESASAAENGPANPLSTDEMEVWRQLRLLGITEEHVRRSHGRSSRSSVTGTYRIILHKIHKARDPLALATCTETEAEMMGEALPTREGSRLCSFL